MSTQASGKILITGGAGFIGAHCVQHFSKRGFAVTVVDDLSRKGTDFNLGWLQSETRFGFHKTDIRDFSALSEVFRREGPFTDILHLAAQVAVTTSTTDPRRDFEINALGTFNVLECQRQLSPEALLMYSSTNKVYGELTHVALRQDDLRYHLTDRAGITEKEPLDFHSPYGCSKGAADQYVVDYARIYGLRTVSFRQSCIYGERQFGVEDQGWVAWFIIAATLGLPITIYGSGKQVRDLLFVGDLVAAYEAAMDRRETMRGEIFNLGGGNANTLSILEFLELLKGYGIDISRVHGPTRPGDQLIFVSDNAKALNVLGWKPEVDCRAGIARLIGWVRENRELLARLNGL